MTTISNLKFCKYLLLLISFTILMSLFACSQDEELKQLKFKKLQVKWNWENKIWLEQEIKILEQGEQLYLKKCSRCHSVNGMGDIGKRSPVLISNPIVTGKPEEVIKNILFGRRKMPAFSEELSNKELASVISYIRNAWRNRIGAMISQKQIEDYRHFNLEIAQSKWNWEAKKWQEHELKILEEGEKHYLNNCSGCHLKSGAGQLQYLGAPALKGNPLLTGKPQQYINIVLHGRNAMPAYGSVLSNEVIAAIISYGKNAWGNHSGIIVSADLIKSQKN